MSVTTTFLLDTNTVSYIVRGRSPAVRQQYLVAARYATIALSTITEAEIRFGLERRPGTIRLRANFERFFASVRLLAWDSTAAQAYAKLRAQLTAHGKTLALMDLLIAAQAIAVGAVLVSHDAAFSHAAPFVQVEDWATDL